MKEYKIYIHYLKKEKQIEILEFLGLKSPEEGNLNVTPLTILVSQKE